MAVQSKRCSSALDWLNAHLTWCVDNKQTTCAGICVHTHDCSATFKLGIFEYTGELSKRIFSHWPAQFRTRIYLFIFPQGTTGSDKPYPIQYHSAGYLGTASSAHLLAIDKKHCVCRRQTEEVPVLYPSYHYRSKRANCAVHTQSPISAFKTSQTGYQSQTALLLHRLGQSA